jgi:hypothetical protein
MHFSSFLEKDEMGETCGTHGAEEKCGTFLVLENLKEAS